MNEQPTPTAKQIEVLKGLHDFVHENLSLLAPIDKAWQPTDFLPDLTAPDWRERLAEFRGPARELSDEVLVVLVGDMITEEALPNYAISLNAIAQDYTGISKAPWAVWLRGWTAEENRHGDLLNAYLRLTGRVDMRAIEVTIHNLISSGFTASAYPDLYAGLVYTSFQERATKVSHNNVAKLAAKGGDDYLAKICRKIAGDEACHETFYTRCMGEVLRQDPENALVSIAKTLRRSIAMPGKLMYDGKDPDLFDHFSVIAQRMKVYTVEDYSAIMRHLVDTWKIAQHAVSGAAARAQEFLCKHAERILSHADLAASRLAMQPPVAFSWIYDRRV